MRFLPLLVLVACAPSSPAPRALLSASECLCACADAGVDAAPDAPADAAPDAPAVAISLTDPWVLEVLSPGAATGTARGADGVAMDAVGCIVSAYEEGASVARVCPIGSSWNTEVVATGLTGAEDAKPGDFDGDGTIDVVTCADSGSRCYITFRGSPTNVTTTLTASMGHGRAMQAAVADVNGDSLPDVIFGTRVGSPAVVAWLENPGALARTGSAWSYHQISTAGWVMSLVPRDVDLDGDIDVIVSDRAKNGTDWSMYGAHWKEQTPTGWIDHPISLPAGSCAAWPAPCNKTPGDEMFLSVDGNTVYDCTSNGASADSRISIHRTTDWLTWTHETLAPVASIGHCQGVQPADVDHDGDTDLIVTTWKGNAIPLPAADAGKSGVYWLRNDGGGVYARGEVSGAVGGKYDNCIWDGVGCITSEQLDPAGGLGVVRWSPP